MLVRHTLVSPLPPGIVAPTDTAVQPNVEAQTRVGMLMGVDELQDADAAPYFGMIVMADCYVVER